MKTNTLKTTPSDHYEKMSADIGRDARPVKKLTPPTFEDATVKIWTPNLALSQAVECVIMRGVKL